jgi:hypothetical protein
MTDTLSMWTIYDHPSDYPQGFIARRWEISAGSAKPTDRTMVSPDLEPLRDRLGGMGLFRLDRAEHDDAKIVETWV